MIQEKKFGFFDDFPNSLGEGQQLTELFYSFLFKSLKENALKNVARVFFLRLPERKKKKEKAEIFFQVLLLGLLH